MLFRNVLFSRVIDWDKSDIFRVVTTCQTLEAACSVVLLQPSHCWSFYVRVKQST